MTSVQSALPLLKRGTRKDAFDASDRERHHRKASRQGRRIFAYEQTHRRNRYRDQRQQADQRVEKIRRCGCIAYRRRAIPRRQRQDARDIPQHLQRFPASPKTDNPFF